MGFYHVTHALRGYEFELRCSHLKNSFILKLGQTSDACTRGLLESAHFNVPFSLCTSILTSKQCLSGWVLHKNEY